MRSRARRRAGSRASSGSYSGIMGLPLHETAHAAPRGRRRRFALERQEPQTPTMQDILINWSPQETRVAIVEHGAVQELHVERTLERGRVGNIYLGKVARVLPGMQSAFIDIGLERAAFLHVADCSPATGTPRGDHGPERACRRSPIEKHRVRRADADGAGHQGPDRHQGRAAVDADQHRRAPAGLPAAGQRTSASRRRSARPSCASSCARA